MYVAFLSIPIYYVLISTPKSKQVHSQFLMNASRHILVYAPTCSEKFTSEPRFLLGLARIYDMLNDQENAIAHYKRVLVLDASSVEAIACLGAHYFYSDQVRDCGGGGGGGE